MKKIFLLSILILTSCGGGPNPDRDALLALPTEQNVAGEKFNLLSAKENLILDKGTVRGHGKFRFAQDLGTSESGHNFLIKFKLTESSILKFTAYAHKDLSNGITLSFGRSASGVRFLVSCGGTTDDASTFLKTLDVESEITLSLDIHNNEGVAHLVLWDAQTDAKLFDSAVHIEGLVGRGQGQHWGMELHDAHVLNVHKGPVRNAH